MFPNACRKQNGLLLRSQSAIVVLSGLNANEVPELRGAEATKEATWSIFVTESLLLNDGIPLPPFCTWRLTVSSSGLSSSRVGPICPVAFAALSVWHPAHPALAKTFAPGEFESALDVFFEPPPQPLEASAKTRMTPLTTKRGFIAPVRGYDSRMAVRTESRLDAQRLRADFPIFEQEIHGKPLAYLDSAVTSQKPRQVLDAMRDFYETSYANVHRGVYTLSERATAEFEQARQKVAAFVNAPSPREIIFTRQATEALNLVAYAWGLNNLVSNALGTINPIEKLTRWAHEQGAIMVCDGAQAAPHHAIDVQALGCDFLALSAHKMCGPTGVGALWGRLELLEAMEPFNLGGHMIRKVRFEETTWGDLPHKFEAGTSPIAEAVGLAAAIDYLTAIGIEAIEAHEQELAAVARERLAELPGVKLYGPPAERRAG